MPHRTTVFKDRPNERKINLNRGSRDRSGVALT